MQSDHPTRDRRWLNMLGKQLQNAEVALVAQFGKARITLRDVVNMKAGDVIYQVPELLRSRSMAPLFRRATTACSMADMR